MQEVTASQWFGPTAELLELYGSEQYSPVWTYRQAWASGVRQWDAGDMDSAIALFSRVRHDLLQIHHDLYPEDSRWKGGKHAAK